MLKKNYFNASVFLFLFFITYIQFKYIGLYHDDYGYASLSYAIDTAPEKINLLTIFEYLKWHYMNWGGRVLFYFFGISAMQLELACFMILQSMIVAITLFYTYKTCCLFHKKQNIFVKIAIVLFIASLYLLIKRNIYKDGPFWAAASITYVWPLCPLSIGVYLTYLFDSNKKVSRTLLFSIAGLFFLSGFSQEQIALAAVFFMPLFAVSLFMTNQNLASYKSLLFTGFVSALGGFLILYMAPGNFQRLHIRDDEPFLTFSDILVRIPEQTNLILSGILKGGIYGIIVCLCIVVLAATYSKRRYIAWRAFPFLGMAAITAGVMYISPAMSPRMFYPTFFLLPAFMVAVLIPSSITSLKNLPIIALALLFIVSCYVYHERLFAGYYKNYPVIILNDTNMKNAAKTSPQPQVVTFYKLPSLHHANAMPYDNRPYIEKWIKNYYRLSPDIMFQYVTY